MTEIFSHIPASVAENRALKKALAMSEARAEQLEQALRETVEAHDRLSKEFHHRIKNSLQVIQSYLALSRRQRLPERNTHLAEAEAKVLVISGAYRMALGDGTEHALCVRTFLEEVVRSALVLLLPDQRILISATMPGSLPLDRAIPLGLALVEATIIGVALVPAAEISLTVERNLMDDARVALVFPGSQAGFPPPSRVMLGLKAQLGAMAAPPAAGAVLDWAFPVLPPVPPVLAA